MDNDASNTPGGGAKRRQYLRAGQAFENVQTDA